MKPLLEYVRPPEICLMWHCGNAADPETGFCHDCAPPQPPPNLTTRIVLWVLARFGIR